MIRQFPPLGSRHAPVWLPEAAAIASRTETRAVGMRRWARSSRHTTSLRSPSASGRAIRELSGVIGGSAPSRDLVAPMPGLVLRVLVEPGQQVEMGTPLVVIEAMKMENELRSETSGVVGAVEIAEGDTVNRDDPLVRFETTGP